MAAVTRSLHSFSYHVLGHTLQIVGPADLREKVDEGRREVESVIAELSRLVIPGKDVMIIVPTFAKGEYGNPFVLRRIDVSIPNKKAIVIEYWITLPRKSIFQESNKD